MSTELQIEKQVFYGQFNPPVDKFIYERYFANHGINGVFIECGAFDGLTECSCKFFEETMGWAGYNIEPLPWTYKKLCSNRPDSKNYNLGLSNKNGTAIFTAIDHPEFGVNCNNGSLNHTEAHLKTLNEMAVKFVDIEIQTKTWKTFIEDNAIPFVDLLVLDVEGHELEVIEGMHDCNVLPSVICIEIGHLSFTTIREKLHELNYVYDVTSHVNAFFIHRDYLAITNFRKPIANSAIFDSSKLLEEKEKCRLLTQQNQHLSQTIQAILNSKTMRIANRIKKLLFFWR